MTVLSLTGSRISRVPRPSQFSRKTGVRQILVAKISPPRDIGALF